MMVTAVQVVLRKQELSCSSLSFSLERKESFVLGSKTGQGNLTDLFEHGHLSGDPICNGLFGKRGIAVGVLSSCADDGITLCDKKKSANSSEAFDVSI